MLSEWIRTQCEGMQSVVELGCGFGTNLAGLPVPQRVGVDIYRPYLDRDESNGAMLICGDMLNLSIGPELARPALALLIDVIEHVEKDEAIRWLNHLKCFYERIAVQTPFGFHKQDEDAYGLGGDEYQTHRSGWMPEELESLGFDVTVVPGYHALQAHKGSPDAIFGVFNRA